MGKMFRSRFAVSSAVTILMVVLLLGTFASALLYVSTLQMQNIVEGAKPIGHLSEAAREKIDAERIDSESGTIRVKVKNTGLITVKVTQAWLTQPDGSLTVVDIEPDRQLVVLEEAEIAIPCNGSCAFIGLQTERGNVFPVATGL